MKTWTLGFCVALAAVPAGGADLPGIKAGGTLRVIAFAEEQPETFSFAATGEPGFDRELVEGFARLHKLKVEAVSAPSYPARIAMLTAGQGDVVISIVDTEERRRQVAFTTEVLPSHNVLLTLAPSPVIETLAQLPDGRVGVVSGTASAEDAIKAGIPAGRIARFEDGDGVLAALVGGTLVAAVRPVSEFALAAKRLKGLQAGMVVGPPGALRWAVRKEDTQLRAALDEYLGHGRRGPGWSRLVVKYFGDQALGVLGRTRTP